MTVLEVIQRSTEFLARKGLDSPRLQVELLLAHILKVPRLKLYLDFERLLTDAELDAMRPLVKRRANREPLQHLIGSTSFCGLEIIVNGHVLIPRPETETLAELAWQFLQARSKTGALSVSALDFGTGSGCLAVAIAYHAPAVQVDALDLSNAALEVAHQNAARNQLSNRIRFYESDGFRALPPGSLYDLIAANPPYIPSQEIEELAPEVRDHDPRVALDGGPDGLDLVRRLAVEGAEFLKPAGQLLCEFGDGQAEAVRRIYEARHWHVEAIAPDLSGRARILVARQAES